MAAIDVIIAREILDSRGNPTVEVEVMLDDDTVARAAVPSGASTGAFEASERRDGGTRYGGKGVLEAVKAAEEEIAAEVIGLEATEQRLLDQLMIDLDGTPNKSRLGANAILGVSLAVAKAAALLGRAPALPLRRRPERARAARADDEHPQRRRARRLQRRHPGVHDRADRRDHVRRGDAPGRRGLPRAQERAEVVGLLAPASATRAASPRRCPATAPRSSSSRPRSSRPAWSSARTSRVALDVAATEFHSNGTYAFEGAERSAEWLTGYYESLVADFPLVSIEDPLSEDDWAGWVHLTETLGDKVQIVGDDLFVTNPARLQRGIDEGAANALLVKVNQIGTLTETLDAVALAHRNGYRSMMSHRSGETEDTTIADLAVATDCGQIKTGAPARSERVAKYNQLLRIEEELAEAARYAGASAFPRFAATS